MLRRSLTFGAAVILAVAGCSSSDGTAADETDTTLPATTTSVVATTAPRSTTSTTAVAATTTPTTVPGVELPGPGEPWDLLFIRALYLGSTAPEMYAQRAEQALGVEIRLHDIVLTPPYAWRLLSEIQDVAYPQLGELVRQAEMIVFVAFPEQSGPDHAATVIDEAFDNCEFGEFLVPEPPTLPTAEDWQPYRDYLDAIYSEIWTLREGLPTLLIPTDVHNPFKDWQRDYDIEPACNALWAAWSDVIGQAAEDHGASMVSVFEAINGPDGTRDPVALGYTGGPTVHFNSVETNATGSAIVADALAAAGFEPTTQP